MEMDDEGGDRKKRKTQIGEEKQKPLEFEVIATWNKARVAKLKLNGKPVTTPIFMPVGTQGTVKGLTSTQLEELNCGIILGNTYHLGHRPGPDVLDELGGLHKFMNWKRGILTDSGGFQMVSLLKLAHISEEGVKFQSPHDGTEMLLTPEHSIHIQNKIGAGIHHLLILQPSTENSLTDIIMALDDVVHSTTTGPRVEEAMHRTIRWLDRCIAAHQRPHDQNLFAIVQGGLDTSLRTTCLKALIERDLPGYAIGGLSGGESKDKFWRIVDHCTNYLPTNKPRYLMGVGYALDLLVCSSLGVDMYDCVFPSRTARFGSALVRSGSINLKSSEFARDFRPLDEECKCMVCKNYTRAYLHSINGREQLSGQLLTYHNIAYQMDLMKSIQDAIVEGRFPEFVRQFIKLQYPKGDLPSWAKDALTSAG